MSPFALELMKGQLQQIAYYDFSPVAGEADTFLVTRRKATGGPSSQPAPSIQEIAAAAEDADIGLQSGLFNTALPRKTTLSGCSCQFLISTGLPCRHILRVLDVRAQQLSLPLELLHERWRLLDEAQLRVLKEALFKRRPARAGGGEPLSLTAADRHGLAMSAARDLADLAASSDSAFRQCMDGLAALKVSLRSGSTAACGTSGGRKAGSRKAGGGADAGDGADGEQCGACGAFGHRRTNRICPRFNKPELPKPASCGRKRAELRLSTSEAASSGGGSGASDGDNDDICHKCSQEGELACCDTCTLAFHVDCLPHDALPLGEKGDRWSCPVCAGSAVPVSFIGNPQRQRPRGRPRQKRHRAAHEATNAQKRMHAVAAKAAASKQAR